MFIYERGCRSGKSYPKGQRVFLGSQGPTSQPPKPIHPAYHEPLRSALGGAVRRGDREWESHGEVGPVSIGAMHGHGAAQPIEQLPSDAQAEPRAAELARARLVHLPEILPDRLQIFLPDADAGVDDVDPDAVLRRTRVDADAPLVRELYGVGQQVQQHL